MSVILLADDSPHAQRMGDKILHDEGYQVSCVPDGAVAARKLAEIDPDLVIADAFLPGVNGYELCRYIKANYSYMRVILTAGLLEDFDEDQAKRSGCDAVVRKPFEATEIVRTIRPLALEAQLARELYRAETLAGPPPDPNYKMAASTTADPARVRAAITKALEASLPALVREITEKVLVALGH
jgi:CheY-like chemotaxis protein